MPRVVPEYKEEARRRIIDAGFAVLAKKGYCATTMDDIAAHIGVSKGALYLYFKNKDDLVIEIIKTMDEDVQETMTGAFSDSVPLEGWTVILDRYLDKELVDNSLFTEVLAMTSRNEVIKENLSQKIIIWLDMATLTFARQQSDGLVRKDIDPRTLAIAIISVFFGLRNLSAVGIDQDEIRKRWTEMGKLLFDIPVITQKKTPRP
jgi:AcrR family transcriptional regulator